MDQIGREGVRNSLRPVSFPFACDTDDRWYHGDKEDEDNQVEDTGRSVIK